MSRGGPGSRRRSSGSTCASAANCAAATPSSTMPSPICSRRMRRLRDRALLKPRYRLVLLSKHKCNPCRALPGGSSRAAQPFRPPGPFHRSCAQARPAHLHHARELAGSACPVRFCGMTAANVDGARACGWHGVSIATADDLRGKLAEVGVTMTEERAVLLHCRPSMEGYLESRLGRAER